MTDTCISREVTFVNFRPPQRQSWDWWDDGADGSGVWLIVQYKAYSPHCHCRWYVVFAYSVHGEEQMYCIMLSLTAHIRVYESTPHTSFNPASSLSQWLFHHKCTIFSDVSSTTWPRPRGASRTKSSGLGLGLDNKVLGLGLGPKSLVFFGLEIKSSAIM